MAAMAINLLSTIVLARLLSPEDYGVISMVLVVTAFAALFRDLGLSSSTVQKLTLSHEQLSTLFWINVAAGATLTVIVAAASPLVAWFYRQPELSMVTLVLSSTFVISSFSTQQGALLTRQMRFGRKTAATIAGAIATFGIAAGLALRGLGYWSLVWGNIAGQIITTILLNNLSGWHPGPPVRKSGVRSMLKYGANITAFDFVNYFHRNLDNLLIGRIWGADALGIYSRAYQLMMYPITHLRGPIIAVAFPALSRLQNHPNEFRAYYRKVNHLLAFTSMPAISFLYLAAKPMINLVLGTRWAAVTPIFSILAIIAFIQPVASLRGVVLLSLGRGRKYFYWGLANALIVSIAFLIGVQWEARGLAISYCIATYAILYPSIIYIFRDTPLSTSDFFAPVARPAISSMTALGALKAMEIGFHLNIPGIIHIGLLFISFAFLYCATYVLIPGGASDLRKVHRLIKETIGAKRARADSI
jgi:PST family polysaccharide transporter